MTVSDAKSDANGAKEKLIEIMDRLLNSGHVKQAEQLESIIIKLEVWQNK